MEVERWIDRQMDGQIERWIKRQIISISANIRDFSVSVNYQLSVSSKKLYPDRAREKESVYKECVNGHFSLLTQPPSATEPCREAQRERERRRGEKEGREGKRQCWCDGEGERALTLTLVSPLLS